MDVTEARIIALSGASGCGKTALCEALCGRLMEEGRDVAGVLSPPVFEAGAKTGILVRDIKSGEEKSLAGPGKAPGVNTGKWYFSQEGMDHGLTALTKALPCDLLVVDELGPIELLRSEGWAIALDLLRSPGFRKALVVVRPSLLERFSELVGAVRPVMLTGAADSRDEALAHLYRLLALPS